MNYIFLDIDGVLNNDEYFRKHFEDTTVIDEKNVKILSELVKNTNARIVLSSSWRIFFNDKFETRNKNGKSLLNFFKKYGLKIFDRTKVYKNPFGELYDAGHRYDEISGYIKENLNGNDKYVIFDDEDFNGTLLKFNENFIQTDFMYGIRDEHLKKALRILQEAL